MQPPEVCPHPLARQDSGRATGARLSSCKVSPPSAGHGTDPILELCRPQGEPPKLPRPLTALKYPSVFGNKIFIWFAGFW